MHKTLYALLLAALSAGPRPAAAADAAKADPLGDYLVNIDAGAVSAGEILGLSGSAVASVHTVKDLVAALNAASGANSKGGFGIAFTPARSGVQTFAMPIARYVEPGNHLARLWGNTTFSYAQNRNTVSSVEYRQDAIAMRVGLFLDDLSDPVVASHAAFKADACRSEVAPALLLSAMADEKARLGHDLTSADQQALRRRLKQEQPIRDALVKDADLQAKCIRDAADKASARWNASQLALSVGQGWIRSTAPNSPRLSLARHLSLAGSWGPNDFSLLNLTLRRVDNEVDLGTLATTPSFNSSTLAAARYTSAWGAGRDFYAIAEISNASQSQNTLANTAFKYALGVDKKLGENMWLELRLGRSRVTNSSGEETAALLNLKIAPSSGIATLPR